MARAIDGTKATKEVMEYSRKLHEAGNVDAAGYVMWAASIVDKQPTIEPEPIVRCRDCDVPHNKWTGCPKLNGLVPPDNFYCAFGVRRDSDGKDD